MKKNYRYFFTGLLVGIGIFYFSKKNDAISLAEGNLEHDQVFKSLPLKEKKVVTSKIEQTLKESNASQEKLTDESKKEQAQEKLGSIIFYQMKWKKDEKNCDESPFTTSNWDFESSCTVKLSEDKDLELKGRNLYNNDELRYYRTYAQGTNEPINFNNENSNLKTIQFLLNDYAFMAILLDRYYLANSLEFDLDAYRTALKYKGFNQSPYFKKRFYNMLNEVNKVKKYLAFQCTKLKHQRACIVQKELLEVELKDVAKHHLYPMSF